MVTSKEYWKQRETENLRANVKTEAEYNKELKRIYRSMQSDIQKDIDAFYGRYAAKEGITIADAKKRAAKLDIEAYSDKAKKYVAEKNFSDRANEEMRLYNMTMKVNRLELLKAEIGLELAAGFDEVERVNSEALSERARSELRRQAGILGQTVSDNVKSLNTIVNASFKNATYSERIWGNQSLLKGELNSLLTSGLIQGKNPRELARSLRKVMATSQYNAERLMITELARVQTEAQKQSFERNGFKQYMFVSCEDIKVCETCAALDGKHFDVDKMQPGENAPPMHPNCRCSVSAYEDTDTYEAWIDAKAAGEFDGSWEKWKARSKVTNKGAMKGGWNDKNDPYNTERDRIAEELYAEIRNRKSAPEIEAVARNTDFTVEEVRRVYEHVFIRKHRFEDGTVGAFDPDYYMAHSWMRMREGKRVYKHDLILLRHELAEEEIMGEGLEIVYEVAHNEVVKTYDYRSALLEYLKEHDV